MDAFRSHPPRRPTLLVILDGVGLNPSRENNALALAHTPHLDRYFAHHPHTVIEASGRAVGLPTGQMGNSEVGHTTWSASSPTAASTPTSTTSSPSCACASKKAPARWCT